MKVTVFHEWLYFNEKGETVNFISEDSSAHGKNRETIKLK